MYNNTLTLQEFACKECVGKGFEHRYLALSELYELLAPAIWQGFIKQLPEIIAKSQMEVIESVMES